MACELCDQPGGGVFWSDERCRAVRVEEAGYPGFCRVIWNAHVKEMSDLAEDERAHLMRVVFALETVLRERLAPDKINLASLGNLTPHLHWHVIPRFRDDPHFPQPIWAAAQRPARAQPGGPVPDLGAALAEQLAKNRTDQRKT